MGIPEIHWTIPPPYALSYAPEGIVIGQGFGPDQPEPQEVLATARAIKGDEPVSALGNRFPDPCRGWVLVRPEGRDRIGVHSLPGGGTWISWDPAFHGRDGVEVGPLVFEPVGSVFHHAWRTLYPVHVLARGAPTFEYSTASETALAAASTCGPRDFGEEAVFVKGGGGYGLDEAYLVRSDGVPIGMLIGYDETEVPPQDAIVCRPARQIHIGQAIGDGALDRADLRGRDLSGLDLRKVDFYLSDLRGANFADCDLRGASFLCARADHAVFDRANLAGANLSYLSASKASFVSADLRGATLTNPDLKGADLRGAVIAEATFDDADLTGADLTGVDLDSAEFIDNS